MALADPWSDSLAVATPICAAVAPLNIATVSTASAATTAGKVPITEIGVDPGGAPRRRIDSVVDNQHVAGGDDIDPCR